MEKFLISTFITLNLFTPLQILFSPALHAFKRFTRTPSLPSSLRGSPYLLIVHGSADRKVPLEDSMQLLKLADVGKCRLEVLADDHHLKSLTQVDLGGLVDEAYARGRENVVAMFAGGDKFVDPTLFDEEEGSGPGADPRVVAASAAAPHED
eukprot:GHVT01048794.1.p1 GENE.GHVT01048794.1~~GHVT01048794.1.p1  ORF type:complete len:152 (-),score=28.41 GHVT01048794.1:343-798(-)